MSLAPTSPLPVAVEASASATPVSGVYRAGSIVYDGAGLRRVFTWLLLGELVFTLIDMLEPKVLPVLLKGHGASDKEIAIIVGSVNAVLQLLIMAPIGYYSDRLRTRWGRRIPLLFWVTPFATLFLALTPFAPEIAAWLTSHASIAGWLHGLPIAPVILSFAVLVILYRAVQTVTNVMFFGLLRDVIPDTHMGRFLALFRLVGAGATFIITYWLLGHADTQSKPIFLGVAALNLLGFSLICWRVKEGTYPPPDEVGTGVPARPGMPATSQSPTGHTDARTSTLQRLSRAVRVFIAESYTHPVYLWVYFIRICLYGALLGLSGFVIFFPQYELGMSLPEVGRMLSWPSLAWLVVAYPVGRWVDRYGAMRVLWHGLVVITLGYLGTFFFVVGPKTFFISALVTGVGFWVVMLAQLKVTQEVFHPQRYSQLAGANTIVQSILIALVISPACGWILDALKGWQHTLSVPGLGPVVLGPYRLVNLMLGVLYGLAWFGLVRVRHHWKKLGGPDHYAAPL